ncbi:MAG: EAL domain-containing protein [Bauldia sp.]
MAAAGIAAGFAPILAAKLFLSSRNDETARATANDLARQMVTRAERVIDLSLDTLTDLAHADVHDCSEPALLRMQSAAAAQYAVKEIAITDPIGTRLCDHFGRAGGLKPLSEANPTDNPNVELRVAASGERKKQLMVTWSVGGEGALTALIPIELVSPDQLPDNLAGALAVMTLRDGTLIGTVPRLESISANSRFGADSVMAKARSTHYPIDVSLHLPLAAFAGDARVATYVTIGGLAVAALVTGLVILAVRRSRDPTSELKAAVAAGEFSAYYQPVIDITNGQLIGAEALIRWVKPNGRVVSPSAFIGLAEANGIAVAMTRALMERIRDDLAKTYGARPQLKIGINLFGAHFQTTSVVDDVSDIFSGSRVAFSQLVFEITERQPLEDIHTAHNVIKGLQDLGARVALDDAGTGHGGLAYLQQLAVDAIKIDKMFIDTIGGTGEPAPILDALIGLGRDLGLEVIAEGVETTEQVFYLRTHGVNAAQGYLFAPPLPAKRFVELIEVMCPIRTAASPAAPAASRPLAA